MEKASQGSFHAFFLFRVLKRFAQMIRFYQRHAVPPFFHYFVGIL
jgi:hypothetical protein